MAVLRFLPSHFTEIRGLHRSTHAASGGRRKFTTKPICWRTTIKVVNPTRVARRVISPNFGRQFRGDIRARAAKRIQVSKIIFRHLEFQTAFPGVPKRAVRSGGVVKQTAVARQIQARLPFFLPHFMSTRR